MIIVKETSLLRVINSDPNNFDINNIKITKTEQISQEPSDFKYTMTIPIRVDLRNALTSNVSKLQVRILKNDFSEIQYASRNSPDYSTISALNSWALSRDQNILTDTLVNLDQQTINQFNSDFTTQLNNSLLSKINTLSDEELFGTRSVVVTAAADSSNQGMINETLNMDDPYSSFDDDNLTFENASELLYRNGYDPASSFDAYEDELSIRKVKYGLMRKSYSKPRKSEPNKKLIASLRGRLSDLTTQTETIQNNLANSTDPPDNIDFRTYEITENLRYQDVPLTFSIKQSELDTTNGNIHIAIFAVTSNNIILEHFSTSFPFEVVKEVTGDHLYYPSISMSAKRSGVNRDMINLTVKNNSRISLNVDIFAKKTSECSSRILNKFSKFKSVYLAPGSFKTINASNLNLIETESERSDATYFGSKGSVLFRAIGSSNLSEGIKLNNTFYTNLLAKSPEHNVFVPMVATINNQDATSPFINIEIDKPPINAKKLVVLKRNLTKKEKKFKFLSSNKHSLINSEQGLKDEIINSRIKVLSKIGPFSENERLSFTDYDLINDNVYEYRLFIDYGGSNQISSINSCIVEFVKKQNLTSIEIDNQGNLGREGSGFRNIFDLRINVLQNDADALFSQLPNELYDLFSADMSEIRASIGNSVKLKVFRYDRTFGEHVQLPDPDIVNNEDGTFSAVIKTPAFDDRFTLKKGAKYLYQVHPYVMNVSHLATIIKDRISSVLDKNGVPNDKFLYNKLMSILAKFDEISTIGAKYSSRAATLRGTIETPESAYEKFGSNLYSDGKTGDYYYFETSTPRNEVTVSNANITLRDVANKRTGRNINLTSPSMGEDNSRAQERRLERLRLNGVVNDVKAPLISFEASGDFNFVDYYVLSCEKNGIKSIVGSIHQIEDESVITYFDVSQIEYQGLISYYVTPVFEDGSVQETSFLGSLILNSKFRN